MTLFIALLLAGAPAATAEPAPVQPKVEKQICKRFGASESRMAAKRICKTAAEWRRMTLGDERVEVESARAGRTH